MIIALFGVLLLCFVLLLVGVLVLFLSLPILIKFLLFAICAITAISFGAIDIELIVEELR